VLGHLKRETVLRVNKSTGFHVHVDATNFSLEELKKISQQYVKFEKAFDLLVPPSRRGDTNELIQSNQDVLFAGKDEQEVLCLFRECESKEDLIELINPKSDDGPGRYCKLNLHAITQHNTIEFRHHSGTSDIDKICNWVRLLVRFVKHSALLPAPRALADGQDPKQKFEGLFDKVIKDPYLKSFYEMRAAELQAVTSEPCCSGCGSSHDGGCCNVAPHVQPLDPDRHQPLILDWLDMPLDELMPIKSASKRPKRSKRQYNSSDGGPMTSDQLAEIGAGMAFITKRSHKRGRSEDNDRPGGDEHVYGDYENMGTGDSGGGDAVKRHRGTKAAGQDVTKWHQVFGTFHCHKCAKNWGSKCTWERVRPGEAAERKWQKCEGCGSKSLPRKTEELIEFKTGQLVDVLTTRLGLMQRCPQRRGIIKETCESIDAQGDTEHHYAVEFLDDLQPEREEGVEMARMESIRYREAEVVLVDGRSARITCASNSDCTYNVKYVDGGSTEGHVLSARIRRRPHARARCGMCKALGALCHRYFSQQ
jgi:hypothetical protein